MENELVKYISKFITLNEEEINALVQYIPIKAFKKGTILLKEGDISSECFFNLKGLVRQYYLVDGEEKTTYFYSEKQSISSIERVLKKIPSKYYLSCVEDTTIAIGRLDIEQAFYEKFPKFETLSRLLMEEDLDKNQTLLASFIIASPEERYLNLLKSRPDLVQRVPQYQLASYLGMKPESLSRIRKRISLKK